MPEPMELEARLAGIATELEWPATPDLRAAVRGRIVQRGSWYQSRWALAAVAVIVILAVLLAYTPTRTAIADWLNLHVRLQQTSSLPTPSPQPPGPLGKRLGLGSQTTLPDARAGVGWAVLVPSSLGRPDEVYLQNTADSPDQGEVTLVYAPRPDIPVSKPTGVGVLVTEARGSVNEQFFGKMLGSNTTIEMVTVNGHRGWWISGAPHDFYFIDAHGTMRSETMRLATNTLIIDDGGTIVRIEGNLVKSQALDIAASLG